MKNIRYYITSIVGLICLIIAFIMAFKDKTLEAILYTQLATLAYIINK